jgi:glycosyltransferase involved in cell wall biosynthesis
MNVSLSSIGKFWQFDLARQLLRLGNQVALFTGNPKSRVDPDLRRFARTHPALRILSTLQARLGLFPQSRWLDDAFMRDLGSWLARSVDPDWTDVLHGLDGPGPEAGRRVKAHGKVWICDRGSAHILTQKQIVEEEHKYWEAPPPVFTSEHLERCIAEYEEADAITVPSQFAKRSFLEHGIASERVFVCPYGVDLSEFHQAVKADGIFRVIFVGEAGIRKGIGYLLRAVEPLVKKRQCELWLVGSIDPAARHVLDLYRDSFEYKGVCPRGELWRLYSQASVMVLASVEEGLALVQAQAMACGIPVIATTNTGAEDLFADGVEGFIVPIRSPEAIREKLEWMIAYPALRKQMAEAGLERVKGLEGWDRYGERVNSVYREVASRLQSPCAKDSEEDAGGGTSKCATRMEIAQA